MKKNIKFDFDFVVGSFLKYSFQEDKIIEMYDIEEFIKFLKIHNIEVELSKTFILRMFKFLDKYENLIGFDAKSNQIILNNPNRLENLLKLKDVILKSDSEDVFSEIEAMITKIKSDNYCSQMELIRKDFIDGKKDADISLIGFYIYIYKNYKHLDCHQLSLEQYAEKTLLKKNHYSNKGALFSGVYDYEEIPNLKSNDKITGEIKRIDILRPKLRRI